MLDPLDTRHRPSAELLRTHLYGDGVTEPSPPNAAVPAEIGWTLDDVDRLHRRFVDDAKLVRGHSAYTLGSYVVAYRNFRAFLLSTIGVGTPVGPTLLAIEAWLRWNRDRAHPVCQTTLHSYWNKLRSFFEYLERMYGVRSPFRGLRPPTLPSRIPKARSAMECMRILESARQYPWPTRFERVRAVAILGMALFAGLRRGEILRLHSLDVDLQQGLIRVERGKGRGGGKDRVIPIGPDLREILEDYLVERRRHNLTPPEFFTCLQSRAGVSLSTFNRIIRRVRQASQIPFAFHSLRHSFLTQLLRSGVPIHTVSALAGHTQITTTAGYLKVFDEDKEDAVRRLRYGTF